MSLFKKLLSIILTSLLIVSSSLLFVSVKAESDTYQHIFITKPGTGNNITLSGESWNISATNLGNYNSGNYAGVQLGTSKANGSITLTSSSAWGNSGTYEDKTVITEVRLWLNLGGTSVTPSVTIGGTAAVSDGTTVVKNSSAGNDYTKATMVTFTPATGHDTGVVVINVETVKAGYICAIEIDCEEPSADAPTLNVSNKISSIKGGETHTFTPVVTNIASPVYEWFSSNEDAATISSEGVLTPAGIGTTTITLHETSEDLSVSFSVKVWPDDSAPISITEANAVCLLTATTNSPYAYTVEGYVKSIDTAYNSQHDNISFTITDFTNDFVCFRVAGGDDLQEHLNNGPVKVSVTGYLVTYNSTKEFAAGAAYEEIAATTYTVSFDTDGGSVVADQVIAEGDVAQEPSDPTWDNHIFQGWYTQDGSSSGDWGSVYNFSTVINANITIYAKWEEVSATALAVHNFNEQVSVKARLAVNYTYNVANTPGSATTSYSGSTTNMTGNNDAAKLNLESSLFSVVGDKGGNSYYPGLNSAGDLRLYYHAEGSNTVTFTINSGSINYIVLTFTEASYSNVSVTVGGSPVDEDGETAGKYAINSSSFVLGNANTSNVQVRISSVEIHYTEAVKSNFAISDAPNDKKDVSLQFGTVMTEALYDELDALGAEFGMLYAANGTSFAGYDGTDGDIRKVACNPVKVDGNYQFGVTISNFPADKLNYVIDAKAYVYIDGVYYVSDSLKSGSVKSIASAYVNAADTSSYTNHLPMLNWLAA